MAGVVGRRCAACELHYEFAAKAEEAKARVQPQAEVREEVVQKAKELAASKEYPSAAVMKAVAQQVLG